LEGFASTSLTAEMPEGVTLTEPSGAKEMVEVRGYRSSDEAQLLSLWNAALPYDPIDRRTFHRKVLLDPNFDPDWLLVADADGKLVGFCLCLIRRVPMEKVGMEVNKGWITAFGVHPEWRRKGIGTMLLERAIQLFRMPTAPRF